MKRVAGKTALVTAAGKGIGRASALALVREGATVWATDVDDSALAELAAEAVKAGLSDLKTGRLDVLDTAAVQAFAARTGKVDVLFNCAGFVHHGSILDCEEADWDFSFDLNAKASTAPSAPICRPCWQAAVVPLSTWRLPLRV